MRKSTFWLLASCSFAALASPALAQEAATDDSNEIVVTAQHRAQNVQDVPIAMNVLTAEKLQESGVNDLNSLTRLAPDVAVTNDTVFTRVAIRGIGTNSNEEAQDSSLTINIDGEYLNRPLSLNASMFDLERIEVLRGPQGTLYGRNATGGAINIVTRHPQIGVFGGNASIGVGNFDARNFDGALNVPLGDKAALRFSGMIAQHDGYSEHPNLGLRSDDQDVKAGRIGFALEPNDAWNIYLAAEHVQVDQTSVPYAFVNNNNPGFLADEGSPGACSGGWVEVAPGEPGAQCSPNNTHYLEGINRDKFNATFAPGFGVGTFTTDQNAVRAEVSYDFGNATLTYRGGYREVEASRNTTLPPSYVFIGPVQSSQTWSNEIRLSGGHEGGFLWQTGLFFFQEDQQNSNGLFNPFFTPNGTYINYFYRSPVKADSEAIFGQVEIPIVPTLTAVLGARYTEDNKEARFTNYSLLIGAGPTPPDPNLPSTNPVCGPPFTVCRFSPTSSDDRSTWSAGLNWKPSEDMLVYARASTGFKAGGFDNIGSYSPELITSYEIGTKNTFDNNRYVLNLAGFYYDYSDLQVSVLINSQIGNQVFNAGKATIWGLEGQFEANLTANDHFSLTANYLNANYDQFLATFPVQDLGPNGLNAIGQSDLSGNKPVQSPDWVLTLGYDHVFNLGNAGSLTASVFSRYKSDYFTSVFNYADSKQDAFTQTDASLQYENPDHNWRLQAFVRNIENERPLTFTAFVSAGPDDVFNWAFGAPRTYGAKLSVDF